MSQAELARVLTAELAGVEFAGRSPRKFDRLSQALARLWGIDSNQVGVKALAHPKNYGNRISEATRAPIRALVLVAQGAASAEVVQRALSARAVRPVQTVLAVRVGDRWEIEACFDPDGSGDILCPGVPVYGVDPRPTWKQSPGLVNEAVRSILSLTGQHPNTQIAPSAEAGRLVVVKKVESIKNLANRIGEGLGRQPPVFALRTSARLANSAREALEASSPLAPTTNIFLVIEHPTALEVQAVGKRLGSSELSGAADGAGSETYGNSMPPTKSEEAPQGTHRYRTLERVKQLRRHLPLDAGGDLLYEEHTDRADRLRYETKTLGYIRNLLTRKERVVVVLTGNAGHGKTHMCRRLLEEGGDLDGMAQLADDLFGECPREVSGAGLPVRFIKDLSELSPPEHAAERLEQLVLQQESHVVVCANEGRLRDVVSRRPEHLDSLLRALESGAEHGDTCPLGHPDVHVVNLNHQAAAARGGGFLNHVLDHFLNHEGAWKVCRSCAAQHSCPILANRRRLAMSPMLERKNAGPRRALTQLIQIAEQGGYVLTYRETLVLVAYLVTGGLSCSEVEDRHRKSKGGDLDKRGVLNLLFEVELTHDEQEILRILKRIRRLDPGRVALRTVDQRLHQELENRGDLGSGFFGDEHRQLHKRAELKREEKDYRQLLRGERRAAWLSSDDTTDGVPRARRLGLEFHHLFELLCAEPDARDIIATTRALIRGLHTVQGALGVESMTSFHLVDPAFGRSGSHSAVVARSMRINDLELISESSWWRELRGGREPPALDSVEWLDRRLVLVDRRNQEVIVTLDLMAFEFVMGAGHGIVMRDFHSAERRLILRRLAHHAERGRSSEEDIRVLLDRGEGKLTVDRVGTILLERTA